MSAAALERADRSAKPVLSGNVYCSKWCGFKCTKAAHDRAVREAAQLAERMGEGWEPTVWENGGWHWSARKGQVVIHPSNKGSSIAGTYTTVGYTAYLNFAKQVVASAKTPELALAEAKLQMDTIATTLVQQIAEVFG